MKIFEVLVSYMREGDYNDDYHAILRVVAKNEEEAIQLVDNYSINNMFDNIEKDYLEDSLHVVNVISSHQITDYNTLKELGYSNHEIALDSDVKLFHYSFKDAIFSEGILANMKHDDTKIINDAISKNHDKECFGRDHCVFLNFDKRDDGDFVVSVDLKDLNPELLYIADQNIANEIYNKFYKGYPIDELSKQYVASIKPFLEYNDEYSNPELFYLDDIPSELLTAI